MPRVVEVSPLAERLAETVEDFSQANTVTVSDVLDALEIVYARVERATTEDLPCIKMH